MPDKPFASRGCGAIFYVRPTEQFMFYLRDDKPDIPCPGMVSIIGGHLEADESPLQALRREIAEELDDLDTGRPFQSGGLLLFRSWVDGRNVEQNIYGCQLDTLPRLRLNEGQQLVFLGRDQLATTEFAFNFQDVVLRYAASL